MSRAIPLSLFAVTLAALGVIAWAWPWTRPASAPTTSPLIVWTFEPRQRGGIVAGVTLHGNQLYTAVVRDAGLGSTSGAVHCVDRFTGKGRWEFDDAGAMLHTISTPHHHARRLYFGEGMHGDVVSRLYCLDLATGTRHWSRAFGGHIESGPVPAGSLVLLTAGDDGLHAVEAETGRPRWGYRASGHTDGAPVILGDKVYAGSAVSRQYDTPEIFCLHLATGKPAWRTPSPLPVWASPVLDGNDLFVAIGNGRLTSSEPPPGKPAGALLCIAAETGAIRWRADAADGVLARPAVDADRAYFVCRDGYAYAVDRADGSLVWKHDLAGPAVAAPAFADGRLYVVSTDGLLACLRAATGERLWSFDLARYSRARPRLLSGPVVGSGPRGQRWVYLGTELRGAGASAAIVFCLEEPATPEAS
jgi:outer membrane protein assembly factor BamB